MTQERAAIRKRDPGGRRAQASKLLAGDAFGTYACASDPAVREAFDNAFRTALRKAAATAGPMADLYVDGSFNPESKAAGIGLALIRDCGKMPWEEPNACMGKTIRACGSAEAEIWAVAVGISYALCAYPEARCIRLNYDCASAAASAVCAAGMGEGTPERSPYTNLASAMKRARKAGVTIVFRHVKAHAGNRPNEACDAIAKHFSGLSPDEYAGKYLKDLLAAACRGKEACNG